MIVSERQTVHIPSRAWFLLVAAFFCFFTLILRLWYLQIVSGDYFRSKSENNRLRTIYVPSPRGLMLDRNGAVLARSRPSFNIDIVIEDSPNPKGTIRELARMVGQDPQALEQRVFNQSKRRRFEPKLILRDVSRDVVAQIAARRFEFPGVIINVVPAREYVYGERAAHVLGYIREITGDQLKNPAFSGYRSGDLIGQTGIETKWEQYLRGERGVQAVVVNAAGAKIGEAFFEPEIPGHSVVTTLDSGLQEAAEQALAGKRGAIVALDPQTGEVLALASAPTYDPNLFTREISKEIWDDLISGKNHKMTNRAVQGVYPPGSVFKIFVALAGLAEEVMTPGESVFCPGHLQFGRRTFRCHKHSGHGTVNLIPSIAQSCDVYFYTMGQRLGVDRIHQYATLFGYGELTGIDLPDESPGLIPSTAWKRTYFKDAENQRWYPGETLPVAIGQGAVGVTPLQTARALAAVVNGGKLLRPRLIRSIIAQDGRVLEEHGTPELQRTIKLDKGNIRIVRDGMLAVVNDQRGTGHKAKVPNRPDVIVAGKTGTSQVAGRDSGLNIEDHAWFAGYAPEDDPKIIVVAISEHGGHGGAAAAPMVSAVLARYFERSAPPDAAH